jgi:short-subunit dehydrogenase
MADGLPESNTMNTSFYARYGPWAVVAGASEGLGKAFAEALAGKGLDLVLIARRRGPLRELAAELKEKYAIKARVLIMDLGSATLSASLKSALRGIEIGLVVYNAAFSNIGGFLDRSLEDHYKLAAVNCLGPLTICHELAGQMKRRARGGVILMSSLSGMVGSARLVHYAASKAYLRILAEGLWYELKRHGVDVLACCAGAIDTPNYRRSLIAARAGAGVPAMRADSVAAKTLAALGKKIIIVPGFLNKLNYFLIQRILSRKRAVSLIGGVTERMYNNGRGPQASRKPGR